LHLLGLLLREMRPSSERTLDAFWKALPSDRSIILRNAGIIDAFLRWIVELTAIGVGSAAGPADVDVEKVRNRLMPRLALQGRKNR
jgi:hypothetical protein